MIVECPDCVSRFRLADDKLKPGGTRVRCSKCRKVFTVMPRESVPPANGAFGDMPPASQPLGQEEGGVGSNASGQVGQAFHEFDFGDNWEGATAASGEEAFGGDSGGGDDFDFGAFDDDADSSDFFGSSVEGEDGFYTGEDAFSMGAGESGDDHDFFGTSPGPSVGRTIPSSLPADSASDVDASPDAASREEDDFLALDQEETASGIFGSDESPGGPLPRPVKPVVVRKSGRKGVVLLFVLLLAGMAAAGYFAWKKNLIDVGRILALVPYDKTAGVETGQIQTRGLGGFFVQNRKAGRLFVIQGEAVNGYQEPRSAIAVKGLLFDAKGTVLLQQTVFCGNALDTVALQNMSFDKIVEHMSNQFGDSLSNLNVPAGKAIPFTIVFRNLPAGLNEFSVEVVDSKPASR